jgi:hypothetical protein
MDYNDFPPESSSQHSFLPNMEGYGAGRRSDRSMFSNFFGQPSPGINSIHSVDPILPPPKRNYTIDSFAGAEAGTTAYQKIELGDVQAFRPASTAEKSLEGPKVAIRYGFWPNASKLLPHLAAAAVTAAVVQLSFRNEYWVCFRTIIRGLPAD